jgi:hypothetical protein
MHQPLEVGCKPGKDEEAPERQMLVRPTGHRMTGSRALLCCRDAGIVAAWGEAWETSGLGDSGVYLSNPRWERRSLRFLELLTVGRVIGDGGEDETQAGKLDLWIPWEKEEWVVPRAPDGLVVHLSLSVLRDARRVLCLDEVLSWNVRRRAEGRVIFRA